MALDAEVESHLEEDDKRLSGLIEARLRHLVSQGGYRAAFKAQYSNPNSEGNINRKSA